MNVVITSGGVCELVFLCIYTPSIYINTIPFFSAFPFQTSLQTPKACFRVVCQRLVCSGACRRHSFMCLYLGVQFHHTACSEACDLTVSIWIGTLVIKVNMGCHRQGSPGELSDVPILKFINLADYCPAVSLLLCAIFLSSVMGLAAVLIFLALTNDFIVHQFFFSFFFSDLSLSLPSKLILLGFSWRQNFTLGWLVYMCKYCSKPPWEMTLT